MISRVTPVAPAGAAPSVPVLSRYLLLLLPLAAALTSPHALAQRPGAGRLSPQMIFERLDVDRDGRLTREELAGRDRLLTGFDFIDANADGAISLTEFEEMIGRAAASGRRGGARAGEDRALPPPAPQAPPDAAPPAGDAEGARAVALPQARFGTITREVEIADDLPVTLTFPLGEGEFPIILFSPYLAGQVDAYAPLAVFLAEQGYVVATLHHADSIGDMSTPGGREALANWRERPEDLRRALDHLRDLERVERRLQGRLDYAAVGVGGHLIGAFAASLLVGAQTSAGETWRDPRVDAALLMAPQGSGSLLAPDAWADIDAPMMVITGTAHPSRRTGNPAVWRTEPFTGSTPPDKYLVYVEGMDGRFGGLFDAGTRAAAGPDQGGAPAPRTAAGPSGGNGDDARQSVVLRAALSFWDAYLRDYAPALAALQDEALEADSGGLARMSTRPGAGLADDPNRSAGPGRDIAAPADYQPLAGTWPVGQERLTLYDTERRREVPVQVYAPAAAPTGAGWPVIVFSHGLGESRDAYGYLGEALAANGYAIVFMNHAGSDAAVVRRGFRGLNTVDNAQQKAADMHFVIDQVTTDAIATELLRGRVDTSRLVAAGQCAGSSIAAAMGGLTAVLPDGEIFASRDERVDAVFLLGPQVPLELAQPRRDGAGDGLDMLKADSWTGIDLPMLVVAAERDFMWYDGVKRDPRVRLVAYDTARSDEKYLVDLMGGGHHAFTDSDPWYPAGPRDPQHHRQIGQAVVAFLDAYLREDLAALAWLQDARLEDADPGDVRQAFESRRLPREAPSPVAQDDRDGPRVAPMPPVREEADDGAVPGDARSATGAAAWDGESLYKVSRGPHRVDAVARLDLEDRARGKTLQVRVTWPVTEAASVHPVIVFAHGAWATNEHYQPLVEHWASHGYVVLQANHADSAALGTRERDQSVFRDWRERPQDVHFLIDSLAEIERRVPALAGRLDTESIGVGGHSYGAHTAQLVAGTRILDARTQRTVDLGDDRVDAALLMSPQGRGRLLDEDAWDTLDVPMMVMTGSNDPGRQGDGVSWRIDPFLLAASEEKHLLFIEGAWHDFGGATGGTMSESRAHPDADIVRWTLSASTAFWDAYLAGAPDALAFLRADAMARLTDGEVTLTQSEVEGERLADAHRSFRRPYRRR